MDGPANAQQIPINVVGSSTFGRHQKISAERTYNMFISDKWLINTAGYQKAIQFADRGEGRGAYASYRGNFLIVVVNNVVYRVETNLSYISLGNINSNSGPVYIDENLANQICLVDGINMYIYFYSGPPVLTLQTGGVLGGNLIPNYVCYHNSFFLIGNANTTGTGASWYVYERASDTTITRVVTRDIQTKPDYAKAIVRIPSQGNNVLALGRTVAEIHTSIETLDIYRRNSSVNVDYGVLNEETIASFDRFIMWLGFNNDNDPVILKFAGQMVEKISTDGIDYLLQNLENPTQSFAMKYRQDGHLFYQITFYNPKDNLTLLYDCEHDVFFNLSDNQQNFHPARKIVHFNNRNYFISFKNGSLYEQSTDYTTYNENLIEGDCCPDFRLIYEIPRIRVCGTIRTPDTGRYRINTMTLLIEAGYDDIVKIDNYGIITEDGILISSEDKHHIMITEDSPNQANIKITDKFFKSRVDLSLSKDGGYTFSTTVPRFLRGIGRRKNIMRWQRLGRANELTAKFKFYGLKRFVVNNAAMDIY